MLGVYAFIKCLLCINRLALPVVIGSTTVFKELKL